MQDREGQNINQFLNEFHELLKMWKSQFSFREGNQHYSLNLINFVEPAVITTDLFKDSQINSAGITMRRKESKDIACHQEGVQVINKHRGPCVWSSVPYLVWTFHFIHVTMAHAPTQGSLRVKLGSVSSLNLSLYSCYHDTRHYTGVPACEAQFRI